jgi:hypothetical protein
MNTYEQTAKQLESIRRSLEAITGPVTSTPSSKSFTEQSPVSDTNAYGYSTRFLAAVPAASTLCDRADQFRAAEPTMRPEKALALAVQQDPKLGQRFMEQERATRGYLAQRASEDRAKELEKQERQRQFFGFSEPPLIGPTAELIRLADQARSQNPSLTREQAVAKVCSERPDLGAAVLAEEKQRMPSTVD